jgi:photosystem II stability/assembly factor-like uncharacterized protein
VLFYASGGVDPKRSSDTGVTWEKLTIPLSDGERIRYWLSNSFNENIVFCATNQGAFYSDDKGITWNRSMGLSGDAKGSFFDYFSTRGVLFNHPVREHLIYHSDKKGIYVSTDLGKSFQLYYSPESELRGFTAGRDKHGITFAYSDSNGSACDWAVTSPGFTDQQRMDTLLSCGYLWIKRDNGEFMPTEQEVGDHLAMAENDSQTIWVTGGKDWIKGYGTKIWLSEDSGQTWELRFHQENWDVLPYEPWPKELLDYSAPGLEIGWWDKGYESFDVNRRNSAIAGGSGYFFLHSTTNKGLHWQAPFTLFSDTGEREKGKKWSSVGLEVTSVYRLKFHPQNTLVGYAAVADMAGFVTDDGGMTYRVSSTGYNSTYDYAFDSNDDNRVYAAAGDIHDYPYEWHGNVLISAGGIFRSSDRGYNWQRLTPLDSEFNRQYLSVGYDSEHDMIYGGSQSIGIIRSKDGGNTWHYFNKGLPAGNKIIPQIEIDPSTGNVYALLTGDKPDFTNRAYTGIWFLDVENNSDTWVHLRGTVYHPNDVYSGYQLWWYPTAFAIDFESDHDVLWLVDYESNGAWLASGVWKSTDRGNSWNRLLQFTHPTGITIDPDNSDHVAISGGNNWGQGGAYYTLDSGNTWQKNLEIPLKNNLHSITFDPNNSEKIFYTFFGGGLLHGAKPTLETSK